MYACMALGVLSKGPVGLILPTAVIGMFLLVMRLPREFKHSVTTPMPWTFFHWSLLAVLLIGVLVLDATIGPLKTAAFALAGVVCYGLWRPRSLAGQCLRPFAPQHFFATCWLMRPITAIAVVLAIAGPWYVWVGLRTDGAWLEGFFLEHNLARATRIFEGHHGTFLFYPASLFGGFFPWSILLVPAVVATIARLRRSDSWNVGYLFAACWIGVYIAAFSLSRTKLPSYITPAYPGVAMMLGAFAWRWSRGEAFNRVWFRLSFGALAFVGVGMCIALPILASIFAPGEQWLGVLGLLPLSAAVIGYTLHIRKQPHLAAACIAALAAIFMTASMGFVGARLGQHQRIDTLMRKTYQSSDQPRLAVHGAFQSSWVFYWGRPIQHVGIWTSNDAETYFRDPDAFLLTTDEAMSHVQPLLPVDVVPLARDRQFLERHDLILLGRTAAGVRLARERDRGRPMR
jgi:4-amino-4-deoxy-L-arabinose transferase-like glycosyltransferase